MSTIRSNHCRLVVYGNDHPPPHAHALGAGWELRIALSEPPALLTVAGNPKRPDIALALLAVQRHLNKLRIFWSNYHG
jgi:hypothetical protein